MPACWRSEPGCFKRGYWRLESFTLVFWGCAELPNACEIFLEGLPLQIHSTSEPAPFDIAEDGPPKYYNHLILLGSYLDSIYKQEGENKLGVWELAPNLYGGSNLA